MNESHGQAVSGEADLSGVGARLKEALKTLGLSQIEVAKRIGASPGFLSEVIGEKKLPGANFLQSVRRKLGISTDWVLTGEGPMLGVAEHFEHSGSMRITNAVVRAAEIDNDAVAKELLAILLKDQDLAAFREPRFVRLLKRVSGQSDTEDLAIELYNAHLHFSDPLTMRRSLIQASINHVRSHKDELPKERYSRAAISASARRGRSPSR